MATFSKLLQKMIKARLVEFLEENNLMSDYQSGCRSNHSCDDNLVRLESNIRRAQKNNHYLLAIFLDLSNAFDKLHNGGALRYLAEIGIKGRMLRWIKDFLYRRKITVNYNGHMSETVETVNGCPQGSVLSPIIFSIIMNTFQEFVEKHNQNKINKGLSHHAAEISQFVDDSATWVTSKCPKLAVKKAQDVLTVIEEWSNKYGFQINPLKTQVVFFRKPHKKAPYNQPNFPKLKLCGQTLEYHKIAKFLGLIFDEGLSWHEHIQYIRQRVEKDINLLRSIKGSNWGVTKPVLKMLYQALILSKINYGSIAYQSATESQLEILQKIQNRALRAICGAPVRTKIIRLQAETAEIPLELHREQNMLKYWARTSRLGNSLPVNKLIIEDPSFMITKGAKIKNPYTQEIQSLIQEYDIADIAIEPIATPDLYNAIEPQIDTSLTKIISKANIQQTDLSRTREHIRSEYQGFNKIYTDGSKDDNQDATGAGIIGFNNNGDTILEHKIKLPKFASIFTCEIAAIRWALKNILEKELIRTVICTDSLSSLQALRAGKSTTRQSIINECLRIIRSIHEQGSDVRLLWVPSHIGVEGNERADQLAKQGCIDGTPLTMPHTIKDVNSIIKRKIKQKFQTEWDKDIFKNKEAFDPLPKKIQVYSSRRKWDKAYTMIRLGVTCLAGDTRAYDKTCACKKDEESFNHVVFHCPFYKKERAELHNKLLELDYPVLDKKILLNPKGKHKDKLRAQLFHFLEDTGLMDKIFKIAPF